MREHKNFWDRNARIYNRFMRKDRAAYEKMYELIRPIVKNKTVLELATGTGLIAKNIVNAAAHIEATDASAEMIAEAKRDTRSAKLHFSVQDMFCDQSGARRKLQHRFGFYNRTDQRIHRFVCRAVFAHETVVNTGISVPEILLFFHGYIPLIFSHSRKPVTLG